MGRRSLDAVSLRDFETLYGEGVLGNLTDGQLLEKFLTGRGEIAEAGFTALVQRHGPMVLGTCRQILGDTHDAEDAFQTTFFVLARKAGSVRKRDSLASWLYGIALRVSMRSRVDAARRRTHERRRAEMTPRATSRDQEGCAGWAQLHEEVARLPEKYRLPVVLCYLDGLSTEAAAHRLGCPQGTVLSRLARARERLRERLRRPGVAVPAGLFHGPPVPGVAPHAVPAELVRAAVQAGLKLTAGTAPAEAAPAQIATLADLVLKMMLHSRLRGLAASLVATGVLTVGLALFIHRSSAAQKREVSAGAASAVPAAPAKDDASQKNTAVSGEIIARVADISRDFLADGFAGFVAIDPETGKWRPIYKGLSLNAGHVSPDGRYMLASKIGPDLDPKDAGLWVYDMKGEAPPRRVFERRGEALWSHNGQKVVISAPAGPLGRGGGKFETWRVNADGRARTKLPIPEGDFVIDCSPDGSWLATRTDGGKPEHAGRLIVVHPDGTGAHVLAEGSADHDRFTIGRFSPDSRRIACVLVSIEGGVAKARRFIDGVRHSRVFIADVDGGNRRDLPIQFEPGTTAMVFWSPQGSRLALNVLGGRTKEGSIMLVDLDGSNLKKIPLPPGNWNLLVSGWQMPVHPTRVPDLDAAADPRSPRGRYLALREEIKKADGTYAEAARKTRTQEERDKLYQETYPHARQYVGRFLELAESAPDDPAAVDALVWVITFGFDGPVFSRAIDRLAEHHARLVKVGHAATSLVYSVSPAAEKLLRAVIEKNPHRSIKALACLALGRYLKHQADRVQTIKEDPSSVKSWRAMFLEEGADEASFARFLGRDPDALLKEAEAVLERAVKEFGDEPGQRGTLADEARAELFEIRSLCPGKPAPEITGHDVEGLTFKLSDYKGKVVLLSFCADWCAACQDIDVFERLLVERLRGKPFVVLGVNGDANTDKLKQRMKAQQVTWRCWCDGGENINNPGPIARRFNVEAWPTLYILDQNGVIRHRFRGSPGTKRLEAAISAVVSEAAAAVPSAR